MTNSKKLYLHIGPHKSATTYIQNLLCRNKDILKSNHLSYPDNLTDRFTAHHVIAWYVLDVENQHMKTLDRKLIKQHLNKINEIQNDVILSSEEFEWFSAEQFDELKKIFNSFKIEVIYYLREPTLRILSAWSEKVKHGATESFFEYAFKKTSINYSDDGTEAMRGFDIFVLNRCAEIFGKSQIHIVNYETAKQNHRILGELLQIAGKPDLIAETDEIVNARPDIYEAELLRYLNIVWEKRTKTKATLEVSKKYFSFTQSNEELKRSLLMKLKVHETEIVLGNLFFDYFSLDRIAREYGECFANASQRGKQEVVKLPKSDWIFDETITSEILKLYDQIIFSGRWMKLKQYLKKFRFNLRSF